MNAVLGEYNCKRGTLAWYTDGSSVEEIGKGIRVSGPYQHLKVPMGLRPNIFQAEITALNLCTIKNFKIGTRYVTITIFTENQATLRVDTGISTEFNASGTQ